MESTNLFQNLFLAAQYAVHRSDSPSDQTEYWGEIVDQLTPAQQLNHQASFTSRTLDFQLQCSKESVEELLEHGYTVKEMSQQFLTSVGKVDYCMRKHGLRIRKFSNISDQHLDQLVTNLVQLFPNAGFKMLTGHYKALGVPVSRDRLRNMKEPVMLGLP